MNLEVVAKYRGHSEEMWRDLPLSETLEAVNAAIPGGTSPLQYGSRIFSVYPHMDREVGLNAAMHLRLEREDLLTEA